jgi:hypothetical protein
MLSHQVVVGQGVPGGDVDGVVTVLMLFLLLLEMRHSMPPGE